MPKIDIDNYIEQSGMRKARFGGYEPEDVHQAMEDLCADYEQHLTAMTSELRTLRQENDALRRHAQGLVMQNQTLSTQNATLAGQVDKLQSYRANLETQFSTVKERSQSLTNQVDMLRLKNSDLTRENKELTERCEEANSALRVKGRAHDQARQQVIADRDKVIADAEAEAARIRQQARDDADQILKDTNLKAEAIDQLAREQAIAQARKMVQSATDETREIQNAHRLRLQDLKSRISEMEKTRGEMMDYLAKMIEELQKTQEYASQNAPLVPHKEELAEAVKLTHQMGKRLYLTCNTLLNNEEADLLPKYLSEVYEMGVDAANLQASIDAYNAAVQPLLQVYAGHNNGWFILPLIAGGTQFLANWIMQKGQPAPDPNNPAASTNKMMMWLFPLMSLWFCLSYNAAFAIYWILTSVSMVLVNLVLNKKFPRAAVAQEGGKR